MATKVAVRYGSLVNPLVGRIQWILEARKITQRELARRAGLNEPHVGLILARLKKNPEASIEHETLLALAKGGEVSPGWLLTGDGDPAPGVSVDATPHTPPTRSGPRLSTSAQRPEVEVLGWFFDTLQGLVGRRKYTAPQSHAATQFLMAYSTKLPPEGPRKIVLGALEAAKELDELGQEMTPEAILGILIEKNAPPSGVESGAREYQSALEASKEFIRSEGKKALKGGYVPKKRAPK